jgi:hypothetical protein
MRAINSRSDPNLTGVTEPVYPPKPVPGDRIAVLSPSSGLPALFRSPTSWGSGACGRTSRVVGYHGTCVMTEIGRPYALAPLTAESVRAALFTSGPYVLRPAERYRDTDRDWADPATFDAEPDGQPSGGWIWHRPDRLVDGRA